MPNEPETPTSPTPRYTRANGYGITPKMVLIGVLVAIPIGFLIGLMR